MRKKVFIAFVFIIFVAALLEAGIFDQFNRTDEDFSISKAETTLFTINAVKTRYLNKSKLDPSDLLSGALDALQDGFSEIVTSYSGTDKTVKLQIYNKRFTIPVLRLKDIWDVGIVLRQVYSKIEANYTPKDDGKMSDIEYVAINGMLHKLDPHSYIFTPEEFNDFTSSTEGNFGGLGIVISMNDDGEITVVSPISGTPAEEAGVEAGDTIVQIDDESAINMTLNKAVSRMRGKAGTKITIYVKRKGEPDLIKLSIVRAIIKVKSVISAMPEPGVGYIRLTGFQENTYSQMDVALKELQKKGLSYIILDLRNNPGGLLSQAIKISDRFLSKGVIVSTVNGFGGDTIETTDAIKQKEDIIDIPMVVMTNEGSASAAEIVTAALKNNGRATVLGRKTFGKGSVQNLFRIPSGGGLKLTIDQYLTPGNISIQSIGITPDIEYLPVYIDKKKISIFKTNSFMRKEKDLAEHIESKFAPKKTEKPLETIRFFKEYKEIKELIKERRKRKVNTFIPDEEIDLTLRLIKKANETKEKGSSVTATSKIVEDKEWKTISNKLKELKIDWKEKTSIKEIDTDKLNVELLSSKLLEAGKENHLKFKVTYPENVENLTAYLDTEIPSLKNEEIIFGTFNKSVERDVPVKITENASWRKEPVTIRFFKNGTGKELLSKEFVFEIKNVKMPKAVMNYTIEELTGNKNGILEENEDVNLHVWLKNEGEGEIYDGRIMILNTTSSNAVFIKKGSAPIKMKPGEKKEFDFEFKISSAAKKDKKIKMVLSVYDFKTRFSAGFSLPVTKTQFKGCIFEKAESEISIKSETNLYKSVEGKTKIASIQTPSNTKIDGKCGKYYRIKNGFWIKEDRLTFVESNPKKESFDPLLQYSINMPEIIIDEKPVISDSKDEIVTFELSGNTKDLLVFMNDKKIYYARLTNTNEFKKLPNGNIKIEIPLSFKEKINRITIISKGTDEEKRASKIKYFFYTKGEVNKE